MISIERLPAEQFDELLRIQEGFRPDPEHSIVVVAKQDGQIIGRMFLLEMAHVEGTWVHDRFRNGTILAKLMAELEKEARGAALKTIFAYSQTKKIGEYIERLGYVPTELKVFRKDL